MKVNKPWVKHYDPGVRDHLDYPNLCLYDMLSIQARHIAEQIAIVDQNRKITYRELDNQSTNFSTHLVELGFQAGDRVGICLPNSIEFAVAYYGILKAGGVVTALNPAFPGHELELQIKKAGVRAVVVPDSRLNDILELRDITPLERIILVTRDTPFFDNTRIGVNKSFITQYSFMVSTPQQVIELQHHLPSTPAVLQFSGGTTGTPKTAICTHQNIVANVMQFRHWLTNLRDGQETFLVAIPLYHVYGMVLGLNLGVAMGARMVFLSDPRNIHEMLNLIQQYQVSYFPGVPSTFNMIIQNPDVKDGKFDLRMIKACISGSAPLPESVRIQFEDLTGGRLVEGYGLSEAPTATHCNPIMGENRSGSIGLPLPDVECRIIAMDGSDADVKTGEPGELLIRAPQVMAGYYNDENETAITLQNQWLHTGDIVRMDKDGYFYIIGRIKDLIKVHGLQVWPAEVEEVLMKHPSVRECVVAGVPDSDSGERVKAWIIPAEPTTEISLEELRVFCRTQLAGYKVPVEIKICASIPRSPVGKVLRRELVRIHLENSKEKNQGA